MSLADRERARSRAKEQVGKRTGVSTTDVRAGSGIGEDGDPMYTLQAGAQHGVVAFDLAQITHPENRSKVEAGRPCPSLNETGSIHVVSLDAEGNATDDLNGTLSGHHSSHNRGAVVAYSIGSHAGADDADVTNRSHANGGPTGFGIGEELANTLRAGRTQAVCLTGDVTHALTSEGHDAGEDGTGRGTPIVAIEQACGEYKIGDVASALQARDYKSATDIVVGTLDARQLGGGFPGSDGAMAGHVQAPHGIPRRLLPVECEALMGWPRNHTLVPDANGKPLSDSARYKACGNGVASPVTHWIGERLALALGVRP